MVDNEILGKITENGTFEFAPYTELEEAYTSFGGISCDRISSYKETVHCTQ